MHTIWASLKKHLVRGIFIGIFTLLLLRVGGANAAALTQKQAGGSIVPNHKQQAFYSLSALAAVSSTNIWAVGIQKPPGENNAQALIEHWDGSQWSVVPVANGVNDAVLSGVAAVSTSDIWAVGEYQPSITPMTLIEHWNGSQWSLVPSPNEGQFNNDLFGVTALSATNVWAVGGYQNDPGGTNGTLIEHWDGTQWNIVPSPSPNPQYPSTFGGVAATSATDIWAVGYDFNANGQGPQTLIEHWDGSQWGVVSSPNGQGNSFLRGVTAISTTDIWAVGSVGSFNNSGSTLIEHWNGTSWSIVPGTASGGLSEVSALSATDIWALGSYFSGYNEQPVIEHWDGSQWSSVNSPKLKSASLFGVAAISSKDVWAVGDKSFTTKQVHGLEVLTEHWNGTRWSIVPSPN